MEKMEDWWGNLRELEKVKMNEIEWRRPPLGKYKSSERMKDGVLMVPILFKKLLGIK